MEFDLRRKEVREKQSTSGDILIISPPNDPGIKLLSEWNVKGTITLICFSDKLLKIADKFITKQKLDNVKPVLRDYFLLQFSDDSFDTIYLNCFLDFCSPNEYEKIFQELNRVLKNSGELFSVHMDKPTSTIGHLWANLFKITFFLNQGCHPVDLTIPSHFDVVSNVSTSRFGFPLKYLHLIKRGATSPN